MNGASFKFHVAESRVASRVPLEISMPITVSIRDFGVAGMKDLCAELKSCLRGYIHGRPPDRGGHTDGVDCLAVA